MVFILLAMTPVLYSSAETYQWMEKNHFQIPAEEASRFVTARSEIDETIVVLCPSNLFYADSIQFYLEKYHAHYKQIYQYPEKPVDAYSPSFNITELIQLCETSHVKYLLLYQYGNISFFQSELTSPKVYERICNSQNFDLEAEFGNSPRKVFVISFHP